MSSLTRGKGQGARGLFVTGTDTGVGKTMVAVTIMEAWARQGLRVAGYKPVAAGCEMQDGVATNDDARRLQAASSIPLDYSQVNPYALDDAIAPHLAAADQGVTLDLGAMVDGYSALAARADRVVVEGAGGWLVPLDEARTLADFASALALPVVMVVVIRLGCLNHSLLTAAAIEASGARLVGWVANQAEPEVCEASRNVQALRSRLRAPLLGAVPFQLADAPSPASCIDLSQLTI
jgi:dethiobiotin synthetase